MTTIGVLGTIGIIVYGLAPESSSVTSFVKTTLLSLVALVIVVGFLQRIDRWEPEPWTTKLAMFLWGGGVATLSAMIMNTALGEDIAATIGDFDRAEALAASFIAPLVEETLKGIGVLIMSLYAATPSTPCSMGSCTRDSRLQGSFSSRTSCTSCAPKDKEQRPSSWYSSFVPCWAPSCT